MEAYQNLDGDSGVEAYESGVDRIKVRFRGDRTYVYDATVPGTVHVERMKELAASGRGLGTYISRHVRRAFARVES